MNVPLILGSAAIPGPRLRALVVPREHGAWGMLLVPLMAGTAVGLMRGGQTLPLAVFMAAAMTLFRLRTPLESWLGATPVRAQTAGERRTVLAFMLSLSAIAVLMLAVLFWDGRNLTLQPLGAGAGLAWLARPS